MGKRVDSGKALGFFFVVLNMINQFNEALFICEKSGKSKDFVCVGLT